MKQWIEALTLFRNRKGYLPHIVVVTAEPMSKRLKPSYTRQTSEGHFRLAVSLVSIFVKDKLEKEHDSILIYVTNSLLGRMKEGK